jgi:ectoine hydroxylase-related dioxygenase (phytanoyl-CoA dioxygenase family)
MKILAYDIEKYNFAKLVGDLYTVPLDELDNTEEKTNLTLGSDTHTEFHRTFYDRVDADDGWPEFVNTYKSFLREVIHPLIADDVLVYQKYPNIRFSRPSAKAVYKWHCDGDGDHKHPPGEINIYLPITDSYDTNTIWIESVPGFGDFAPVNLKYGQCLIAYLNRVRHGNQINMTGKTRVSFDFRVVPGYAHDEENAVESYTTKQSFKVGQYYDKMERSK